MTTPQNTHGFHIRTAEPGDAVLILSFIKDLAEYEKMSHDVVADEAQLNKTLFGDDPKAFVLIGQYEREPVAFALYFYNYSTFLGKPGIYLEDLYVQPAFRGKGLGKAMLKELATRAVAEDCGRLEWSVLDWNQPAIDFYRSQGAIPMDEWTVFRVTGTALALLAT
ncbi:MAG: GNAT family N-acetyltransferase [Spartobacteria bacterium]|nr:GNAT family N-acetyltransferase [Spartobacteria bacterium]